MAAVRSNELPAKLELADPDLILREKASLVLKCEAYKCCSQNRMMEGTS